MAKKRTLNEYRQTKEYQGSSEGWKYLNDLESYGMDQLEKKEKLEKLDKEITRVFSPHKLSDQGGDLDPVQRVLAQQIEELKHADSMESVKEMIANKIIKHFDDWVFEMVSKEMSKHYMFKEDNYLTEAGMNEFEDVWFEWYHNHHGDILYEVKKNLFE